VDDKVVAKIIVFFVDIISESDNVVTVIALSLADTIGVPSTVLLNLSEIKLNRHQLLLFFIKYLLLLLHYH
jgi:hypothetical protein